ncbi:MAG TPA: serine hydrolase [Ktedonobacteraceae bacterium]|nr:serine hydrolase [Ktedonobacteraceae bacterium]
MDISNQRVYWPTIDWQERTPQDVNLNQATLSEMIEHIDKHIPGLTSLLIARYGNLAFEHYAQGFTRHDAHYPASVVKSVISALVGIALQQKVIHHLDQTLAEVFPAPFLSQVERSQREITLRSLLTMSSGLAREDQYILEFDASKNFVSAVLELPLQEKVFHYNNNGPHILLNLLALVTGVPIITFAQTHLFQPLGISTDGQWRITEQGWYPGPVPVGRLLLTPRDMLKIGYLYLNGCLWEGRQIIPAEYVADSTRQHNEGGWPIGVPYGYFWWVSQHEQPSAFFAAGLGGQRIYVVPALDLVIVTTASIERVRENPGQEKEIQAIIPRFILPACS